MAFFWGISELASGRTAAAREALARAISIGVQPYADEAHFYLGKAALRDGDIEAAQRELQIAADGDAGPDGEAARILAALAKLDERADATVAPRPPARATSGRRKQSGLARRRHRGSAA